MVASSGVSIVFTTYRIEPAFGWFADGLARQIGDDDPEVIVVDGLASGERAASFAEAAACRFNLRYIEAKPTVFNGRYRRTPRDFHAGASARNTGLVCARGSYVAFVDDCCVLAPGWWAEIRKAARDEYVVTGARNKHLDMQVKDGELVSSRLVSVDGRWDHGDDTRLVQVNGMWLYSSSVGFPTDLLLSVEGFDEICDGMGSEDSHLGVRLGHAGSALFFNRALRTDESEELHRFKQAKQVFRPVTSHERYMARLMDFGVTERSTQGPCDSLFFIYDLLHATRDPVSLGNHSELATLSADNLEATAATLPERYWFDGRPWHDCS